MKHLKVHQKYTPASVFSNLFSVFHLVMKHCISRLIILHQKIFRLTQQINHLLHFIHFSPSCVQVKVQSTPDNLNLSGKSKKVLVSRSLSYQEYEANNRKGGNGRGMNASNTHTSKLDKYKVLDTAVFKLD